LELKRTESYPARHNDEEGNQEVNEWLSCLLKAFEQKRKVIINDVEMSHVIRETRTDIGSQFYDVLTSMQEGLVVYVAANRKLNDKLLFGSKFARRENEKDTPEGDAYRSIQEVRVEAISRALSIAVFAAMLRTMLETITPIVFATMSKVMFEEILGTSFEAMPRKMYTAVSREISIAKNGAVSREMAEVEVRRAEETNQQLEDECAKCSRVQWQSKEDKSCLQQ